MHYCCSVIYEQREARLPNLQPSNHRHMTIHPPVIASDTVGIPPRLTHCFPPLFRHAHSSHNEHDAHPAQPNKGCDNAPTLQVPMCLHSASSIHAAFFHDTPPAARVAAAHHAQTTGRQAAHDSCTHAGGSSQLPLPQLPHRGTTFADSIRCIFGSPPPQPAATPASVGRHLAADSHQHTHTCFQAAAVAQQPLLQTNRQKRHADNSASTRRSGGCTMAAAPAQSPTNVGMSAHVQAPLRHNTQSCC